MGPRADIYKTNHINEAGQMPQTKQGAPGETQAERQLGSQESLLDPAWDLNTRVSNKSESKWGLNAIHMGWILDQTCCFLTEKETQ